MKRRGAIALVALMALVVAAAVAEPLGDRAVAATSDAPRVVRATAHALTAFWRTQFALISKERHFEALRGGVVAVHAGEGARTCGDTPISAKALAGNALYCPDTDTILWDADRFGPELVSQHGGFALALVIAHEFGHVVQERTVVPSPSAVAELQADCYAGAFAAFATKRSAASLGATRAGLAQGLLGLLGLADTLGTNPNARTAHGSGFDRVFAALEGFDHGVKRCAQYVTAPPRVTAESFVDPADQAQRGNAPIADLLARAAPDLDDHYRLVAQLAGSTWVRPTVDDVDGPAECADGDGVGSDVARWCDPNEVLISRTRVADLNGIGDLAVLAEVARGWATSAEQQMPTRFRADASTTECLTGVWLGTLYPDATQRPTRSLTLSPGDLDEVARAVLSDPDGARALVRIQAMIAGFYSGLSSCAEQP